MPEKIRHPELLTRLRQGPDVVEDAAIEAFMDLDTAVVTLHHQQTNRHPNAQRVLWELREDAIDVKRRLDDPHESGYYTLDELIEEGWAGGRAYDQVRKLATSGRLGGMPDDTTQPHSPRYDYSKGGDSDIKHGRTLYVNIIPALNYFRAHPYKPTKPRKQP